MTTEEHKAVPRVWECRLKDGEPWTPLLPLGRTPEGVDGVQYRVRPGTASEPARGPTVVCLCGSTRFGDAFREANLRETLAGNIVLSIGCDFKSDQGRGLTDADKTRLDELHLRKIDMADEVLILNVGGYIGKSTAAELSYAVHAGKRVRYLEPKAIAKLPPASPCQLCAAVSGARSLLVTGPGWNQRLTMDHPVSVADGTMVALVNEHMAAPPPCPVCTAEHNKTCETCEHGANRIGAFTCQICRRNWGYQDNWKAKS